MKVVVHCLALSTAAAFGVRAPNAFVAPSSTAAFSSLSRTGLNTGIDLAEPDMQGGMANYSPADMENAQRTWEDIWDTLTPVRVQGGALKTWSFSADRLDRVFLHLESDTEGPPEGNPMTVSVDLNQGPDNTPQKLEIISGKGKLRPLKLVIETPGDGAAVFIRNTGPLEFPVFAGVGSEPSDDGFAGLESASNVLFDMDGGVIIQGGAVKTWNLDTYINSAKVVIKTDGRPLNAKVELIQGPNATKYIIQIYTEDGMMRPFIAFLVTPGQGNQIRIVNTATMEFPMTAFVGPSEY